MKTINISEETFTVFKRLKVGLQATLVKELTDDEAELELLKMASKQLHDVNPSIKVEV